MGKRNEKGREVYFCGCGEVQLGVSKRIASLGDGNWVGEGSELWEERWGERRVHC